MSESSSEPPDAGPLQEELFRKAFECDPNPAFLIEPDGNRIVDANAGFCRVCGFERSDLPATGAPDLWPRPDEITALHNAMRETGSVRRHLLHLRARDDTIHPLRVNAERIRAGKDSLILCMAEDITERAAVERELASAAQRWRSVFDTIEDMVVVLDPDYNVLDANRAMQRFIGENDLVGRPSADLFQDRLSTLAKLPSLELDTATAPVFSEVQEPDLGNRWYDVHAYPVRDDSGRICRFVVTVRDITDRKRLAEQLRHVQKMEAVGRLAGGVAHDFNNLLTAITGYADIVLAQLDADSPLRDALQEIRTAGERAIAITTQLQSFSRRPAQAPSNADVGALLGEFADLLEHTLGENVQLQFETGPDLAPVNIDATQLQEVIINVALNSRDAMPDGGLLKIRTSNRRLRRPLDHDDTHIPSGRYVAIEVADDGAGMDAATCARAIEPFFTTKDSDAARGLGLSTAYSIVRQNGGHLDIHSRPGEGTTVTIFLPAVEGRAPAESREPEPVVLHGTETILLVEDEAALRKLAATVLRSQGYQVIEAGDGIEALRICREHPGDIHLLLADVVLPRMNGPSVAERMSDFKPGTPVLFMSGYTDESTLLRGVLDQPSAFIPKPFTAAGLAAKVRETLDAAPGDATGPA